MADIFISYAREDRNIVAPLTRILMNRGWSVWWDVEMIPGRRFAEAIQQELTRAKCIIVVWTSDSVKSEWVWNEAQEGKARGILLPIQFEEIKLPLGFRQMHTAKLFNWHGEEEHDDVQRLLKVVEGFCGCPPAREPVAHNTPHISTLDVFNPQENELAGIPSKLAIPDKPSLAVLPFDNLSDDPEQEYFSDGFTEDLITDLSKISGLFVISRHSSFIYKGKSATTRQISQELGVRYIVEGSVRRAGDRLRITAQLIDAHTEGHLWAERFDRQVDDIFAIQDELSKEIVNVLKLKLTLREINQIVQQGTKDIDAHDTLIRGREIYYRYSRDAIIEAKELFNKVIEIDALCVDAYVYLARIIVFEYIVGWTPYTRESLEPAFELANKAISLNENHAEAHAVLGWTYLWNKQANEAINEIERALELRPNDSESMVWLSYAYSAIEKGRKAKELAERALRLNPFYPVQYLHALSCAYLVMGNLEAGINIGNQCINHNPNFLPVYLSNASTCMETGREEEARKLASEIRRLSPDFVIGMCNIWLPDTSMYQVITSNLEKLGFSSPEQ